MEIVVYTDLDTAKRVAHEESKREHQNRYVSPVDGGFVVLSYADHWNFFNVFPRNLAIYNVEVPVIIDDKPVWSE